MIPKVNKADLCRECLELYKESFICKRLPAPVDNKITCSHCGRRRFGATYEIMKRGAREALPVADKAT